MDNHKAFSPREIVSELDRFIVGQNEAKKAVAIAMRNRWRRSQLPENIKEEVLPKNILMVGPTGVGKTEIARRLAKLADAPFVKVEATKFTEVGYVGRDVDSIIRDLIEIAISTTRKTLREKVKTKAEIAAEERVIDALVGADSKEETRKKFKEMLRNGKLDDKEIEIKVLETPQNPFQSFDIPGMPGAQMGMLNLTDILGKGLGQNYKFKKMTVKDSYEVLLAEESDKLLDDETIILEAKKNTEENGIVFIDEIDKICASEHRKGGDVSREGVQRDLLPLLEGTSIPTKYGTIKTDHILFIASGAFHLAKPADLLPEFQGRLPTRVELKALTQEDFIRILNEPEANLILQYKEMMKTEGFELEFEDNAIKEIAKISVEINNSVENIGARRLQTVLEKLLEDVSFYATEKNGQKELITAQMVREKVGTLAANVDLAKFIL